ncbi:MAG: DUF2306 domain-containing protein [Hyphomicrobiales bacterium]
MTLAPLIEAPAIIKLHVAAVSLAVVMAPVQLLRPKGTPLHRALGRAWIAAMIIVCVSALLILDRPVPPNLGPISWLHLLALFTLWSLWRAVHAARAGEIGQHRGIMRGLVFGALAIPFAVPGRIMFQTLFGH